MDVSPSLRQAWFIGLVLVACAAGAGYVSAASITIDPCSSVEGCGGITGCPIPTVAITPATRAAATAAGIPTSASCWDPTSATTGQAAGDAKLWLQQHATKNSNISCLNSTFAERLMSFMQAVPGGPPTITDGYRGAAAQNAAKSNGASEVGWCSSYHNYGMAADFNNTSKQTLLWMRQNAPRYGLSPIPTLNVQTGCSYKSSFCDPGHFQIQGSHPSTDQCGICATTGGEGALPGTQTQQYPDDYYYYQGQNANPSTQQPQPTFQPLTPMQPTLPSQTQTTPISQSGSSNAQPIYYTAPTSSALLLSATTSAGTSTSSTLQDLLNALAGGTTTPNTSTSSPTVSVNLVSTDTSLIIIPMQTGQQQPVPPGQNPYAAQQTFTSPDMSGGAPATVQTPPQTGVTTFSNNPVQLVLGGIRAVLLKMLAYLQGL